MNYRSLYNGFKFLTLGYIGHIPSHIIRKMFYRMYGMKIGKNSYIYSGAEIRSPNKIEIGSNVIVGHHVILDGRNGILIEDNVNISTGVWIWTMQHDPQSTMFDAVGGPVKIEEYAWVSGRVTVLPNITIAKGSVVATGAVVTKSTEPFTIVGGVPAKFIGQRNKNLKYQLGENGATPFI